VSQNREGQRLAKLVDTSEGDNGVERTSARYRILFEQALDGVIVSREGRILDVNPALCALYGRTRDELVGHHVFEFMEGADLSRSRDALDRFMRAGAARGEYEVVLPSGETRRLEYTATANTVLGEQLSIIRDVEEQRRAESSLRFLLEAGKALFGVLDYETTLSTLARLCVPALGDWVSVDVLERDGSIRRISLEHSEADKVALGRQLVARQPPTADDRHGTGYVIRTGKSELIENVSAGLLADAIHDPVIRTTVEHLGLVSSIFVPLVGTSGNVLGCLGFATAESGRRLGRADLAVAEELGRRAGIAIEHARLLHEAREANRMKDEFLAVVSHELRTPLNAILGWARLLRGGLADERRIAAIETIERNAFAQTQLIDDLLDVSRIVSGKMRLDVQPVQLPGVVQAGVDSMRPAIEAKGIRLNLVLDPKAGPITGDAQRLQQVVWNLVANATKFTPKGGRIQVLLERINSHVEITVSDSGQGIPKHMLRSIFERFEQGDPSTTRTHGGLGLGLAICRHIVEQHGGTIEAHSEGPGTGATFVVKLPLSPVHQQTRGPACVHPAVGEPLPSFDRPKELQGLRVLVVDDEPDARELVAFLLEQCGSVVSQASSVREGLAAVDRDSPQVVICDIGMPHEDGYEFVRQLRERPPAQGGHVPCAALTAFASVEDRRRALRAGFHMHLAKPVEPGELIAVVANLAQFAVTLS